MGKKFFNSSIIALIIISLAISGYIINCLSKRPYFSTVSVNRENITEGLNIYGKIVSENVADLSFENGGTITVLTHKVGDPVKKGELLARVDDRDLEAQYREAAADLRNSKALLEEDKELVDREEYKLKSLKQGSTANSNDKKAQKEQIEANESLVDAQEASVEAAEANLQNVKIQIDKTMIRAPFDGIIIKQDVEVGEISAGGTFAPGVSVITVMNNKDFKIEAYVSQIDVSRISNGNVADIIFDSLGSGNVFKAKVVSIDPAETEINNISNYKVTLKLDNFDDRVRSGADANIKIYNKSKSDVLTVPQGALIFESNKDYVMAYENGKEEKKEVKVGIFGVNGKVEIISGLKEEDSVINLSGK